LAKGTLFASLISEKSTEAVADQAGSSNRQYERNAQNLSGGTIMTRRYRSVETFVLLLAVGNLAGSPVRAQTGPASSPDRGVGAVVVGGLLSHFVSQSAATSAAPVRDDSPRSEGLARIWLRVPRDAQVWFNGQETKLTGRHRRFFSPTLTPGRTYTYKIRVRWMKDGQAVVDERDIEFRAGESLPIDFTQPDDRASTNTSRGATALTSGVAK
jgi:uncharacterized protein (TIGR03000 family)